MIKDSENLFDAGMVHVKGLLDKDELMVLRAELLAMHGNFDNLPDDVKTKTDRNSNGEIREISHLSVKLPAFRESSVYKQCHALASDIFATNCKYGHDEAIFKSPGSKPVNWHQDQTYSKYDKDKQCVSIWIPMQRTGPANGGMEYVVNAPHGSQRLLTHEKVTPDSFMYHIPEEQLPQSNVVSPEMEPGDVCVHTPLCVHRSHPNNSDELRVAWILQFNKYGASRFLRWNNLKRFLPGI